MADEKAPDAKPEVKQEERKDPMQARIDAEVARRHKAEEKAAALEKAAADAAEASLKEQKKYQELYEGAAPKAKRAEELEKALGAYLASESADLTDEQRALIPEGAPDVQLNWIKKAKAAGVFGKQTPPQTFNGKTKQGVPSDKWYLEIKSDDPRFASLSGREYQEWKAHNRAPESVVVRGGF